MTLFFIISCFSIAVYFAFRWFRMEPEQFKPADEKPRSSPADFVRADFRKLGQRQVRRNDRRLFAAGNRHALA